MALPVAVADGVSLKSASWPPDAPKTLFVLGGRAPDTAWFRNFVARNAGEIWAVDSGVGLCRRADAPPARLIGDRDSASAADWAWAREKGALASEFPRDKDETDFQLALDIWLRERGEPGLLYITGCFGGRLDHLLSNVDSLAGLFTGGAENRNIRAMMVDDVESLIILTCGDESTVSFDNRPFALSLLALSESASGVSISGTKWPLDGVLLNRGRQWAVSNEVLGKEVTVSCKSGTIGLYWRLAE